MDTVANHLCLLYGYKIFNASMKQFGKFSKFISQHQHIFKIDNNSLVSLIKNQDLSENVNSKECTSTMCINETNVKECCLNANDIEDIVVKEVVNYEEVEENVILLGDETDLLLPLPVIEFVSGDIFLIEWWKTADVCYCASLLFPDEFIIQLTYLVLKMKSNSFFITLKPLILQIDDQNRLELIHESFFKMSWQMAKVYVYLVK
jgi:hypothetical protein